MLTGFTFLSEIFTFLNHFLTHCASKHQVSITYQLPHQLHQMSQHLFIGLSAVITHGTYTCDKIPTLAISNISLNSGHHVSVSVTMQHCCYWSKGSDTIVARLASRWPYITDLARYIATGSMTSQAPAYTSLVISPSFTSFILSHHLPTK